MAAPSQANRAALFLPEAGTLPAMRLVGSTQGARTVSKLLVIGFLGLVALTPYERQQSILAPVEGRIVKWHVIEGSRVKKGDLVAEIADNDPEILRRLGEERNAVMQRMTAAQTRADASGSRVQQLDDTRRNELQVAKNRLQAAIDNVSAAEQVILSAEAALLAARQNLDRQRVLQERGLSAVRAVELAQQDFARAQAEVDRATAALVSTRNEKLARESELLRIETDYQARLDDGRATLATARAEIANANGELQRIEVRLARQQQQRVEAPRDGVILRLLAQPGSEFLKSGDPVALFVPDSNTLVVELWVDGNDVPLVRHGDQVRLQFEGWPAIQFAGWPSVAVGTFGGKVFLIDATDNGQGKFRLLVQPDENDNAWPSSRYLRQGVRANGWVLMREVSVGFELWRQFNGFPAFREDMNPEMATGKDKGKEKAKK